LKENAEIKINRPALNRAMRRTIFPYSLYQEKNKDGYLALLIKKTDFRKREITSFGTESEAQSALYKITAKYTLCQKINEMDKVKTTCFPYQIKQCNGACIFEESTELYNSRVTAFLENNDYQNQNLIIIEKGRVVDEKSAVLIENGVFKGFAFYNLNYQISNVGILKNIITKLPEDRDAKNIILSYLRKNNRAKVIYF
jgi:DNA polymerase-3 subunit epsilon